MRAATRLSPCAVSRQRLQHLQSRFVLSAPCRRVAAPPSVLRVVRVDVAADPTQQAPEEQEPPCSEPEPEPEPDVWTSPLDAVWSGWEDPTPENFLILLLSAVAAFALATLTFRLAVVCLGIVFTAAQYSAVALVLVGLAVVFG